MSTNDELFELFISSFYYILKEENFSLKSTLQSFKNKFTKLLKLISEKMFSKHDREKYHEIANDLYNHDIITRDEMFEIHDDYKYAKERDYKNTK